MSRDDWLWDRTGPPDPEVERLEKLLGPYRWRGGGGSAGSRRWTRFRLGWAAAAALLLVAGGVAWWSGPGSDGPGTTSGPSFPDDAAVAQEQDSPYELALLAGSAELVLGGAVGRRFGTEAPRARFPVGSAVRTDSEGSLRLEAPEVIDLTIGPDSEVRLEEASARRHLLGLTRGRLSAIVRPPPAVKPRFFQVGTPVGLAVDLGCKYDLEVAPDGRTSIEVTLGCVVFESRAGEVWVNRGHRMTAPPDGDFGLPVAIHTTEEVKAAAAAHDAATPGPAREDVRRRLLGLCSSSDRTTLWHLLARAQDRSARKDVLEAILGFHSTKTLDFDGVLEGRPEVLASLRQDLIGW